ncbi:MAG: hypothetical protein V1729_04560 [Candidatus Woesearchaeota archaeon]
MVKLVDVVKDLFTGNWASTEKSRSGYKRRDSKRLEKFEELTTQQQKLEQLLLVHYECKPKLAGLLNHLHDKDWDTGDVLNASNVLNNTIFSNGSVPPAEVLSLLHRAIKYDSLRQSFFSEYPAPREQFEMVVDAIDKTIKAKVPVYVYAEIWNNWQGNADKGIDSRKFAADIKTSASGLESTVHMTRKARALLLKKVERLINSSNVTYGTKVRDLSSNLGVADSKTPSAAYHLCSLFNDKDEIDDFPQMYGALLKLPAETPSNVFTFIERAIGCIGTNSNGKVESKKYVSNLYKLAYKIALLLRGEVGLQYRPNELAKFFSMSVTPDMAEMLVENCNQFLGRIMRPESGKTPFRREDVNAVIPLLQGAKFDANLHILEVTRKLREEFGDIEAEYFEHIVDNLREKENALDLLVFAEAHYKTREAHFNWPEKPVLNPFEERLYKELLRVASEEKTRRRNERRRLIEIIEDRANRRKADDHVIRYFSDYLGVGEVSPYILDLGKHNDAWYRWHESADSYMDLNAEALLEERIDRDLMQAVVKNLSRKGGVIQTKDLALIGLACGDALPEIVMLDLLQKEYFRQRNTKTHPDVALDLYDINETMISRAVWNCHRNMLFPSTTRKDVRHISYDDIGPIDRQMIITLFGRTYFNLETASDEVITALTGICVEHYNRGNKNPSTILIEGAEALNMKYYDDRRAEEMHLFYLLKCLEVDREVFCYDPSSTQQVILPTNERAYSTYAPIPTPNADRVEFYFVTLKPTTMLGGQFNLQKNQIIRCGESRVMSPALLQSFEERGFNYELVKKSPKDNTCVIQLIPDYDVLLGRRSPAGDRRR